jgi:acetyl esterase/lipase
LRFGWNEGRDYRRDIFFRFDSIHNRVMQFSDLVRISAAAILLAVSFMAALRAPAFLWMIAIGAEWGHALAVICIGAAVGLSSSSWGGRLAALICVGAAAIALIPVWRAASRAGALRKDLFTAFGNASPSRSSPLVYRDLFLGVSPADAEPQSLTYSRMDGVELSLDFYRAKTSKPAPVVVAIHGGSWHGGDNKTFAPMDHYLAGCGFAVADIIYRLAPKWKFPAALDDTRAAIAFLRQEAGSLGIDPNRIVLLGRSAGGQIALAVAYSTKDPGIRGVISFYAPTDLHWSWENPGNPLVIDTRVAMREYLGGSPSEVPSNYEAASPTRLVRSSSPPTLLLHGGRDALISYYQSDRLTERLGEAGVPHLNLSIPWATHGFDYILRGPGGQMSIYAIEYFLQAVAL